MARTDDFASRLARVDTLVQKLEACADASTREAARELLQTVFELHARGIEQLLGAAADSPELERALAGDSPLSSLLLLHDLHPLRFSERVERALGTLNQRLAPHRASATLLSLDAGEVRVRVVGSRTLEELVLSTLEAAAPDAEHIELDFESAPKLVTLRRKEKPRSPGVNEA